MTAKQFTQKFAITTLIGITFLLLLFFLAIFTTKGSRLTLKLATVIAHQQVDHLHIEWDYQNLVPLYQGLRLKKLSWRNNDTQININHLDLSIIDNCTLVFPNGKSQTTRACIESINIEKITLISQTQKKPAASQNNRDSIELSDRRLPWPIFIKKISIKQFDWLKTSEPVVIATVTAKVVTATENLLSISTEIENLFWADHTFSLDYITVSGNARKIPAFTYEAKAWLATKGQYSLSLDSKFLVESTDLEKPVQGIFNLKGSLATLNYQVTLEQPEKLAIEGNITPLASQPEFYLTLTANQLTPNTWKNNIDWPVLNDTRLELNGTANTIDSKLSSTLAIAVGQQAQTPLNVQANIDIASQQYRITIQQAILGQQDAYVSTHGTMDFHNATQSSPRKTNANFIVSANDFDLSNNTHALLKGTTLNGEISITLQQRGEDGEAKIAFDNMFGTWRNHALAGTGKIDAQWPGNIRCESVTFKLADAEISVNGSVPTPHLASTGSTSPWQSLDQFADWLAASQIDMALRLPNASIISPDWRGSFNATLSTGMHSPVTLQANGKSLALNTLRIEHLQSALSLDPQSALTGKANLSISDISLGQQQFDEISAVISGDWTDHKLKLVSNDLDLPINIQINGQFNSDSGLWQGSVNALTASYKSKTGTSSATLHSSVAINLDIENNYAEVGAACITLNKGEICSSDIKYNNKAFDMRIEGERITHQDIAAWLPDRIRWLGELGFKADIRKIRQQPPEINVSIQSNEGSITSNNDQATPFFVYHHFDSLLSLNSDHLTGKIIFYDQHESQTKIQLKLFGDDFSSIDATANITDLPLTFVNSFSDQLYAEAGKIQLTANINGQVEKPNINGNIQLQNGELSLSQISSPMTNMQVTGEFTDNILAIHGAMIFGGGASQVSGKIDFSSHQPQGHIKLHADDVHIVAPPSLDITSSLDLIAAINKDTINVTGDIKLPKGNIIIEQLPSNAIRLSSDIEFIDKNPTEENQQNLFIINNQLALSLGPELSFSGFGFTAKLQGQLQLEHSSGKPAIAEGEINIIDGKYRAYAQKLNIRRGQLLFAGLAQQPSIDVEAVRSVDDSLVGLRVSGYASSPLLEPFSEPAMPDQDILFRLITGRTPGSKTNANEERLLAQAALASSLKASGSKVNETAEKLGIENFAIGTGDESDLLVSGYIDPSLYVEYGVGLFGEGSVFKLRWDLAEKLALEFISGLQNSLDLIYSLEF